MIEILEDDDSDGEIEHFGGEDEHGEEYGEDQETETVPCRGCGTDVYEDAVQCPVCGDYVSTSSSAFTGRPRWFLILGALGVLALIFALVVR